MPLAKPPFPQLQRGHPLAQGLVIALPFHEGSGGVLQEQSGGFAPPITFTPNADLSWGSGPFGSTIRGTGAASTTNIITLGASDGSQKPSFSDFSLSTWINPTGSHSFSPLLTVGGSFGFWFNDSTNLLNGYFSGNHFSTTALVDDTWNHLGATRNGTTLTFYTNGKPDGSYTISTMAFTPYTMMGDGTSSHEFTGDVDHMLVWNRALSDVEMAAIAADPYAIYRRSRVLKVSGVSSINLSAAQAIPAFAQSTSLAILVTLGASQSIPDFVDNETLAVIVQNAVNQAIPAFAQSVSLSDITTLNVTLSQLVPDFASTEQLATLISAAINQQIPAFGSSITDTVTVQLVEASQIPAFIQTANLRHNKVSRTYAYIII